jgi:hypothetical protein
MSIESSIGTLTVYLRGSHVEPGDERQCLDILRGRFRRLVAVASDSLSRNVSPSDGMTWSVDGVAGVPDAARGLPYYAGLIPGDL